MSELGKLSPVPATDWVTTINTEFAALEKADQDAITTSAKASHFVVERAIRFGGTLKRAPSGAPSSLAPANGPITQPRFVELSREKINIRPRTPPTR